MVLTNKELMNTNGGTFILRYSSIKMKSIVRRFFRSLINLL